MTHHHPANVAPPPRKSKRTEPKGKPKDAPFDLIETAEKLVVENPDLDLSGACVKLSSAPSFLLAAWDSWYEQYAKRDERWLNTGVLVSCLIEHGLEQLQSETEVDSYRELRHKAIAGDLHPRSKVALRQWMKRCSYEPEAPFGSVEHYWFRTWDSLNRGLTGFAKEIGLTKSTLGIACLSVALADQVTNEDEKEAMGKIYSSLVSEIRTRYRELKQRFEDCEQREKEKGRKAKAKQVREAIAKGEDPREAMQK